MIRSAPITILLPLLLAACGEPPEAGRRALQSGEITTWAGDGTQGHDGDGHPLLESWFNQPMALKFGPDGAAVIVDWNNHCVRRSTPTGTLETIIGRSLPGDWPCQTPGSVATCEVPLDGVLAGTELNLNHPVGLLWSGSDGSFELAAWHNHKLLHYDASRGEVRVTSGGQKPGFVGDAGPAREALLNFPSAVVAQADGALLVSDERNNRVRRIDADDAHTVQTVAGAAAAMAVDADGLPATQTRLQLTTSDEAAGADNPPPGGSIALDADGALLIADTFHHCIRRVDPGADGVVGSGPPEQELVSTLAGICGRAGYDGDGGPATQARFNRPFGVTLGPDGALWIADTFNHAVRRIERESGRIETVAGNGTPGFSGDDGPATSARLREPYDLAFDGDENLYIVDTKNNRIRKVAR